MLRFFRDTCASLPDEMMLAAGLQTAPDGSGAKLVGIVAAIAARSRTARRRCTPIKAFGPPVMDAMGPIPYTAQNGAVGSGVAERRAQLLESAFPDRAERRCDSRF